MNVIKEGWVGMKTDREWCEVRVSTSKPGFTFYYFDGKDKLMRPDGKPNRVEYVTDELQASLKFPITP
jgi:hypothetical protein